MNKSSLFTKIKLLKKHNFIYTNHKLITGIEMLVDNFCGKKVVCIKCFCNFVH